MVVLVTVLLVLMIARWAVVLVLGWWNGTFFRL